MFRAFLFGKLQKLWGQCSFNFIVSSEDLATLVGPLSGHI